MRIIGDAAYIGTHGVWGLHGNRNNNATSGINSRLSVGNISRKSASPKSYFGLVTPKAAKNFHVRKLCSPIMLEVFVRPCSSPLKSVRKASHLTVTSHRNGAPQGCFSSSAPPECGEPSCLRGAAFGGIHMQIAFITRLFGIVFGGSFSAYMRSSGMWELAASIWLTKRRFTRGL
jgi:hypothetical protein